MKLKNRSKPMRPPVQGGTYLAVCVYSIDLGEQLCEFEGKKPEYKDKVLLGFELCGITYDEDGIPKPYDLSKTYTASRHKNASIRKTVEAWNGKEMSEEEAEAFDTNDLVGRTAMVNVVLKENGYNDIQSIIQIPAGLPSPTATIPFIRFDIDPWDQAAFDALPEWAQNRVKKSTQYQKEHAPTETIAAVPQIANMPTIGAGAAVVPPANGGAPF